MQILLYMYFVLVSQLTEYHVGLSSLESIFIYIVLLPNHRRGLTCFRFSIFTASFTKCFFLLIVLQLYRFGRNHILLDVALGSKFYIAESPCLFKYDYFSVSLCISFIFIYLFVFIGFIITIPEILTSRIFQWEHIYRQKVFSLFSYSIVLFVCNLRDTFTPVEQRTLFRDDFRATICYIKYTVSRSW